MHILTANILQMVTDRVNIATATNIKQHMAFPLAYLHLNLARSKGQGDAHFDCKNLSYRR